MTTYAEMREVPPEGVTDTAEYGTGKKRTIPYEKYLAVLGLLTLAEQHRKVEEDLRKALYATLEVEVDHFGHNDYVDELLWGDRVLGDLLETLDIEVAPALDVP